MCLLSGKGVKRWQHAQEKLKNQMAFVLQRDVKRWVVAPELTILTPLRKHGGKRDKSKRGVERLLG